MNRDSDAYKFYKHAAAAFNQLAEAAPVAVQTCLNLPKTDEAFEQIWDCMQMYHVGDVTFDWRELLAVAAMYETDHPQNLFRRLFEDCAWLMADPEGSASRHEAAMERSRQGNHSAQDVIAILSGVMSPLCSTPQHMQAIIDEIYKQDVAPPPRDLN